MVLNESIKIYEPGQFHEQEKQTLIEEDNEISIAGRKESNLVECQAQEFHKTTNIGDSYSLGYFSSDD